MNKDPAYCLKICLSKINSLTISKKILQKTQQFPKKGKYEKNLANLLVLKAPHTKDTRVKCSIVY